MRVSYWETDRFVFKSCFSQLSGDSGVIGFKAIAAMQNNNHREWAFTIGFIKQIGDLRTPGLIGHFN